MAKKRGRVSFVLVDDDEKWADIRIEKDGGDLMIIQGEQVVVVPGFHLESFSHIVEDFQYDDED